MRVRLALCDDRTVLIRVSNGLEDQGSEEGISASVLSPQIKIQDRKESLAPAVVNSALTGHLHSVYVWMAKRSAGGFSQLKLSSTFHDSSQELISRLPPPE